MYLTPQVSGLMINSNVHSFDKSESPLRKLASFASDDPPHNLGKIGKSGITMKIKNYFRI